MRSWYYILDEHGEPQQVGDLFTWGAWFEHAQRRLAFDIVDGAEVSTVFLGINHNFTEGGPPVLWETMIFGSVEFGDFQRRYTSKDEAIIGHSEAIEMVRHKQTRVSHE